MTKVEERREAIRLRKRGMTYDEIKEHLRVSKGSLSLWLHDLELNEASQKRLNKNHDLAHQRSGEHSRRGWRRKREKLYQHAKEEMGSIKFTRSTLAYVGAALYWAEGAKDLGMRFSNADPDMLWLYLEWLKVILHVPNDQITCMVQVYLNNGLTLAEVHDYWSETLGIPQSQFTQAVVNRVPKSSKKKSKNVLVHGTVKVTVKKPMKHAAKLAVLLERMGRTTNFTELAAEFR